MDYQPGGPVLREQQLRHIIMMLEDYYSRQLTTLAEVEDMFKAMPLDDLEAVLEYSQHIDIRNLVRQMLGLRDGHLPVHTLPEKPVAKTPIPIIEF